MGNNYGSVHGCEIFNNNLLIEYYKKNVIVVLYSPYRQCRRIQVSNNFTV
jgi:hypothetical protein